MAKNNSNSIGKSIFLCILALIVGFVIGFAGWGFYSLPKDSDKYVSGDLKIHFLELGNHYTGDCTYIQAGDVDILIDAGSRYDSAATIETYLKQHMTDNKIEYVIATHAHTDHIAGFCNTSGNGGGIFDRFETGVVIDFPKCTKEKPYSSVTVLGKYTAALEAEIAAGAVHYTALECYNNENGAQRIIQLTDSISMEILYNYYYDHDDYNDDNEIITDENDNSVCLMFHHGNEKHFLFTGDLEHDGEEKMVEYYAANHGGLPHCELYKGGHHGSGTSSKEALLNAITPSIVCVCCCAGTSEYTDNADNQFPTQDFINRIAPHTDAVYVTTVVDNYVDSDNWTNEGTVKSMNGNILVTSNKSGITVVGSNNSTKLKDTDWFAANRTRPAAWA